jgi:Trk K+ transport system NAD-binding subunit
MDDKFTKDEMEEKIHARFPDPKTTQIVCRCGSITDVADLQICSLDTCMSVIVNAESDATTLKCILVVTRMLKECGNDKAYITAVIRDEQNKEAAELAGEGYVEVLSFQDVISRIIAHSGRYAGLSHVYTDLFDMDGSEFYIDEHPAEGKTLAELNRYFPESIVCGFVTGSGKILLNPEPDYTCKADDRVILFAEDDGVSRMDADIAPVMEDVILPEYVKEPLAQSDMLILGFNSKLPRILQEEDHYVAAGSMVTIALSEEQLGHKEEIEKLKMSNIKITITECDFYDRKQLKALVKPGLSVLVLADDNDEDDEKTVEKKDAKILMILLQLRYLSEVDGYKLNITSEMLRVENQELAQFANVNDFVVSSNITSLIVTQICQSRELKLIFEELLREDGSEIYVRPAKNYVKLGVKTNFYTACEAAARQQEVMIGYRRRNLETGAVEIINNPPKAQEIVFEETDGFVVIAVD